MSHPLLHPNLPSHEIARRQRWAAVGVTLLGILLFATWLASLPARFGGGTGWSSWDALFGKLPEQTATIDINNALNFEGEDVQLKQVVNNLKELSAAQKELNSVQTTAASSSLSTSTIEILKSKLK